MLMNEQVAVRPREAAAPSAEAERAPEPQPSQPPAPGRKQAIDHERVAQLLSSALRYNAAQAADSLQETLAEAVFAVTDLPPFVFRPAWTVRCELLVGAMLDAALRRAWPEVREAMSSFADAVQLELLRDHLAERGLPR